MPEPKDVFRPGLWLAPGLKIQHYIRGCLLPRFGTRTGTDEFAPEEEQPRTDTARSRRRRSPSMTPLLFGGKPRPSAQPSTLVLAPDLILRARGLLQPNGENRPKLAAGARGGGGPRATGAHRRLRPPRDRA